MLLVTGRIGDDNDKPLDGTLVVHHHQQCLPPMQSRVIHSQFKHLVRLVPGPNEIRLDFFPDHCRGSSANLTGHTSSISVVYIPGGVAPPLHLAILVAKDSTETYDATPGRIQMEGNDLPMAVRKFRMAAYMWQAFTAEMMRRNGFGFRTFRFEEEWQQQTSTIEPAWEGRMMGEAKVHIIRLNQTMEEIRKLDYAQQHQPAQRKDELFTIATRACHDHFQPRPNQVHYVAAMYLDTHWDPAVKTIRGHAALGGGDGKIQLGIFGSHCLQSYPASFDQINDAFSDSTRTDTNFVANDCNNAGSSWEAANVGIAAHLHEVGHLLGLPHQDDGIMSSDYFRFSRTFCMWENFATRTGARAHALLDLNDEGYWHRLDCLRFRFHPVFQRPTDPRLVEDTVQTWAVEKGVIITSTAGIAWIEYFDGDSDKASHWEEFYVHANHSGPKQLIIEANRFKGNVAENIKKSKRVRLEIYSMGLHGHATIDDFNEYVSCSKIKIGGSMLEGFRYAFRGTKLGWSQLDGSQPEQLILLSVLDISKVMTCITVYHGDAIDGIEFIYADGETQLLGKRGGKPGGTQFKLDTRNGEQLFGFYVRAGQWIDGLQVWTTQNRKSEMFGNATGGSGYVFNKNFLLYTSRLKKKLTAVIDTS